MPKPSRLQRGIVLLIVVVAAFQIFSVTTAAIPTNRVSTALQPATSYLDPFFTQDWRLFAPNPIAEDRDLGFRGEYLDSHGKTRTTPWIDWSEVELDLIHHKIVGGRAGYITNKLIGPLNDRFFALSLAQRTIAAGDKGTALKGYTALRSKLVNAGGDPAAVGSYLRYETSAIRLGTEVLQAAHPGTSFTAIRYRIVRRPVVPYADRTHRDADDDRPEPNIRRSGWRKPVQGTPAEQRSITSFSRRHR